MSKREEPCRRWVGSFAAQFYETRARGEFKKPFRGGCICLRLSCGVAHLPKRHPGNRHFIVLELVFLSNLDPSPAPRSTLFIVYSFIHCLPQIVCSSSCLFFYSLSTTHQLIIIKLVIACWICRRCHFL